MKFIMAAFFDTNVIRYLRTGLTHPLPVDLRRNVRLSPISMLELVSQIAVQPHDALDAIHAFENWLDVDRAVLLEWFESFYANRVFGVEFADEVSPHLSRAVATCFAAEMPNELVADARELRNLKDGIGPRKARLLEAAVHRIRNQRITVAALRLAARRALAAGLGERCGAVPGTWEEEVVADRLSAYFEFHTDVILRAVANDAYNFFTQQHLNDFLDAEQLLYLDDPGLHFVTCDRGFRRVGTAPQRERIHILRAEELQRRDRASNIISEILEHS